MHLSINVALGVFNSIPTLGTLFDEIKSSNYLQIAIVFGLQTL